MKNTIMIVIQKNLVIYIKKIAMDKIVFEYEIKKGKGKFVYPNGDVYDGEWKNDKRHGKGNNENNIGILNLMKGDKYDGEWKEDLKEGYGIYYYLDGSKYEGNWKDDKRSGGIIIINKGILYYPDSSKYDGDWKENLKNGQGINLLL